MIRWLLAVPDQIVIIEGETCIHSHLREDSDWILLHPEPTHSLLAPGSTDTDMENYNWPDHTEQCALFYIHSEVPVRGLHSLNVSFPFISYSFNQLLFYEKKKPSRA